MRMTLPTCFLSSLLILSVGMPSAVVRATPPTTATAPAVAELTARVDAYMKAAMANDQFRGTILIARDGVPVVSKGYGYANEEWQVANSPQTVFRIGSLAKQFTAMAVLQLQERGKLKVSDPVCRYIDPCPAAWRPITIHHLLTHTSGIPNYTSLPDWDQRTSRLPHTRNELVGEFRNLPLDFAPGEDFKYSNSGYYLLGLVIERASGEAYADFLRKNIFQPLGMTHTGYDNPRAVMPQRAAGYDWSGNHFTNAKDINVDLAYSAGALYSTTEDLLRWDQALYTRRLLPEKALATAFTPFKKDYAYGWRIGSSFGRPMQVHGGAINGFSAFLARFPADRVTVIVLANSDRTSATKAAKNLAALAFGEPVALPTPQLQDLLWTTIQERGIGAAVLQYRELRRTRGKDFDFGEDALNDLGYDLIANGRGRDAIEIFRLAVEFFPDSANAYDSLGEAYLKDGQKDLAIRNYEASLARDPKNANASRTLSELQGKGTAN